MFRKKKKKKLIRITLFIVTISSLSYLVFIFLRHYNSPEKIKERCIVKLQKDAKKSVGKSDKEWGLNIDKKNDSLEFYKSATNNSSFTRC